MRKLILTAALSAVAVAATPAMAAPTLTFAPVMADGSTSATFGNTGINSGTYTDTYNFTLPAGLLSATISSIFAVAQANNANFTSVTLNGTPFTINSTGAVEFRTLLANAITAGQQTLVVSGTSGGNASYSGTIAFSPSAVPEPAAWAMMILGLGMVGTVLRRRVRASEVRFDAKIDAIAAGAAI